MAKERGPLRILVALTYYSPHISGLTVYAQRVVRAMVERGHDVTVLTSHYDHSLPREEMIDGARIVRVPVLFRFSKGVFMPTLPWHAAQLALSHDIVYLHTPQFEAFITAAIAKVARRPIVTSHQCDILLPNRLLRALFWLPIAFTHRISATLSSQIVTLSKDYADNSRYLSHWGHKVLAIYPPIPDLQPDPRNPLNLREKYNLNGHRLIGFVGRIAEDKGVRYLIDAIPRVLERFPGTRFLFVGEQEKVVGEKTYERLRPQIEQMGEHIQFLGVLPNAQLAEFYKECDLLVLPSINSTEAFGMVQVEAMLKGCPVVTTDLPGVRIAVKSTGMGEIVPPKDAEALAAAITRVLANRKRYVKSQEKVKRVFNPANAYDFYEDLFFAEVGMPLPPFPVEEPLEQLAA